MATTSKMQYKRIKITGDVSVERVDRAERPRTTVLIMGPTGAGKSSFIEALGLKGSSKISSNGLDGCTQAVSNYKLNNVADEDGNQIYLVDSPGFADMKLSEMAIVSMLQKWIQDNEYFSRLLYLTPITSTRLPGTQRQVLKTFHALTGVKTAKNVTIVTTMWDNIWGESATKRAEDNYQELQNNIWKEFVEEGAMMSQFYNTEESALSILDQALQQGSDDFLSIEVHEDNMKGSPFEGNLLTDLQDRIQNLKSHIPTLHDELVHAQAQGDQLLLSTLCRRLQEAEENLTRFQKELDTSGLLPPPPLLPLASPPTDSKPRGPSPFLNRTLDTRLETILEPAIPLTPSELLLALLLPNPNPFADTDREPEAEISVCASYHSHSPPSVVTVPTSRNLDEPAPSHHHQLHSASPAPSPPQS